MSDLISRSELIEEINGIYLHVSGVRSGKGILSKCMDSYKELVIKIIKEQPTAFDTEKVVEQLGKGAYVTTDLVCGGVFEAIRLSSAIDIVKKGGVVE